MKKLFFSAAVLSGMFSYAQEQDSTRVKNIDEVIINAYVKKDSDYSSKIPLKAIEDPQVYSSVSRIILENQ